MEATKLTSHQKELVKEVAEKIAIKNYGATLESLDSVKKQACYMVAVQKFLNEEKN